jgi:hypothetical protein
MVTLPLYWGFDGFLEVTADAMLPAALAMRKPVFSSFTDPIPIILVPAQAVGALVAANGVTMRPDLALVTAEAFDCLGELAAGVTFGNDVGGLPFYLQNGLPTVSARETDGRGLGGAVNVPTGIVRVWGDVASTAQRIASRTLNVRAGWVSTAFVVPATLRSPGS